MVKKFYIERKTRAVMGCLLSILAIILTLILVNRNSQSLYNKKQELNNLGADLVNLDRIATDLKERRPDIEKVLSTVPESYEEISQYARKLESIAGKSGIAIKIQFDKNENMETNGLNSTKVKIESSGSYQNLLTFVDSISKLPYHMEIDSLKLDKGEGSFIGLDLTYRLFTYINN